MINVARVVGTNRVFCVVECSMCDRTYEKEWPAGYGADFPSYVVLNAIVNGGFRTDPCGNHLCPDCFQLVEEYHA
jgi:hypothetical protein